MQKQLAEAARDYRYLLDRGYPQGPSLNLVVSRYMLDRKMKNLLYRCVHSRRQAELVKSRLWCKKPEGKVLLIDFYNILLTIVAAISGSNIYLCDDCLVRDIRGSKLRSSEVVFLNRVLHHVANIIKSLGFSEVIIVAEKKISHSLEHTAKFKSLLELNGIRTQSILAERVDSEIIKLSDSIDDAVIATSDIVILMNVKRVYPLTNVIIRYLNISPLLSFPEIFGESCSDCFDKLYSTINEKCCVDS